MYDGQVENNLKEKIPNIISTLEHLLPYETREEELDVIKSSVVEVRKNKSGSFSFDIIFYLPKRKYLGLKELTLEIEGHLLKKAEIIFRWFPGCSVSKIIIVPEQVILPIDLKFKKKS